MSPKKDTQKSAKSTTAIGKTSTGFTDEERVAMKERVQELKATCPGRKVSSVHREQRVSPSNPEGLFVPSDGSSNGCVFSARTGSWSG